MLTASADLLHKRFLSILDVESGLCGFASEFATAKVEPAVLKVLRVLRVVNAFDVVRNLYIFHDEAEPFVPGIDVPSVVAACGNVEYSTANVFTYTVESIVVPQVLVLFSICIGEAQGLIAGNIYIRQVVATCTGIVANLGYRPGDVQSGDVALVEGVGADADNLEALWLLGSAAKAIGSSRYSVFNR